jgi:hypothetical protein
MKISTSTNNTDFKPIEINTIEELCETITKTNYSQSIYKDNYRNLKNFFSAEIIAVDIDNENDGDNYTIDGAVEMFKDYKHIIAPSKSHRKDKHGKVADRFRVILYLSEPITNAKDFTATWHAIHKVYPAIDSACKDASRYFYPSPEVYSKNPTGKLWPVSQYVEEQPKDLDIDNFLGKGQLSALTMDFLLNGAPKGKRNDRLFKASKDMQEQGYTKDECIQRVAKMIASGGSWAHKELVNDDLQTINSAFNTDPKYDKRQGMLTENASFNFKSAKELLESTENVTWIVKDMLTEGGFSVMAGPPKSGKSTLMRQLVLAVSRGGEFLGRQVQQGKVIYLALEEQEGVLKDQYKTSGLTEDDNMMIHTGGVTTLDPILDLRSAILEFKPSIVVIDTLFLLMKLESINDYKQVNDAMAKFRQLARETGTHIITVHHTKKDSESRGANKILGSSAIHGAVDSALILTVEDDRRFFTTSQRYGKTFYDQELIFNKEDATYILGNNNKNKDF